MTDWTTGYSQAELDDAQARYGLKFPPDLVALYRERRPAAGYDWHLEDPRIREMLEWPFDLLAFDVEHGFWWPDWGERPATPGERAEVLRDALGKVSRLIPLYGHRFLPETPCEAGNPVFSMHGIDTIYYGWNLETYFSCEFRPCDPIWVDPIQVRPKHIPFWSTLAEEPERVYSHYNLQLPPATDVAERD